MPAELKGVAAAAIRLAQLLDREDQSAGAANNTAKYLAAMEKLAGPKKKSGGRLQVVSQMAGRGRR